MGGKHSGWKNTGTDFQEPPETGRYRLVHTTQCKYTDTRIGMFRAECPDGQVSGEHQKLW